MRDSFDELARVERLRTLGRERKGVEAMSLEKMSLKARKAKTA